MSGLCDGRRRAWFACRPQASAPRMIPSWRDRAPSGVDREDMGCLHGTCRNDVIGERPTVVGDPHRAIDPLFHQDMGRSHIGLHLIELPVVREGPVAA